MPLIELEQQALRLTIADRLHLIQVLLASLTNFLTNIPTPPVVPPAEPPTVASAIGAFRQTLVDEGLDIDPDEIWGDVRDRTPAPDLPRW